MLVRKTPVGPFPRAARAQAASSSVGAHHIESVEQAVRRRVRLELARARALRAWRTTRTTCWQEGAQGGWEGGRWVRLGRGAPLARSPCASPHTHTQRKPRWLSASARVASSSAREPSLPPPSYPALLSLAPTLPPHASPPLASAGGGGSGDASEVSGRSPRSAASDKRAKSMPSKLWSTLNCSKYGMCASYLRAARRRAADKARGESGREGEARRSSRGGARLHARLAAESGGEEAKRRVHRARVDELHAQEWARLLVVAVVGRQLLRVTARRVGAGKVRQSRVIGSGTHEPSG